MGKASILNPMSQITNSESVRVGTEQMMSLSLVYNGSPVIQAIRAVLQSHLLSGGVIVKSRGLPVDLKDRFRVHVEENFTRFARDILDSVLVLGFAVVVYESEPVCTGLGVTNPSKESNGAKSKEIFHILPHVPPIGMYELERSFGGNSGFLSSYKVYHKIDPLHEVENTRVFVRSAPDVAGNVVSAVGSIHDLSTFSTIMLDLALTAERDRCAPTVATQHRVQKDAAGFSMGDMFADSSAQEAHASRQSGQSKGQLQDLSTMVAMCREMNKLQQQSSLHSGVAPISASVKGADIASRIFTLPKDQELATLPVPQARGDLVGIVQVATDQICSALGVPSNLVYDTKYSSSGASAQMSLLSATIQQLSTFVNAVLTCAYNDIYSGDERTYSVEVVTSPFTQLDDILRLHAAGLADMDVALPLGLKNIGLGADEITLALQRHHDKTTQVNNEHTISPPNTQSSTSVPDTKENQNVVVEKDAEHQATKQKIEKTE